MKYKWLGKTNIHKDYPKAGKKVPFPLSSVEKLNINLLSGKQPALKTEQEFL